jgi:4-aminobutyrate aminotransferase
MTWPAGSHGSTCAGNPVCCAAALATIDLLDGGGLVDNAAQQGARLMKLLGAGLDPKPEAPNGVTEVRGLGLMIGVEFDSHARADAVANLCFRRGLLVLECGTKAIRLSPPLLVTGAQIDTIAELFIAACRDVFHVFHDRVPAKP